MEDVHLDLLEGPPVRHNICPASSFKYKLTHMVAMKISSLLKSKEITADKEWKPKQSLKETGLRGFNKSVQKTS